MYFSIRFWFFFLLLYSVYCLSHNPQSALTHACSFPSNAVGSPFFGDTDVSSDSGSIFLGYYVLYFSYESDTLKKNAHIFLSKYTTRSGLARVGLSSIY